jgi:hypothetical protein
MAADRLAVAMLRAWPGQCEPQARCRGPGCSAHLLADSGRTVLTQRSVKAFATSVRRGRL